MRKARAGLGSILVLLSVAGLAGCDGSTEPDTDRYPVDVTLKNRSATAAHLFVSNESFPCCQVEPGGERTVRVMFAYDKDNRTWSELFRVGRNGAIIASSTCSGSNTPPASFTVTFNLEIVCGGVS